LELNQFEVETIDKPDEEIFRKIINLENSCIPESWRFSEDFYEQELSKPENIKIILRTKDRDKKLIGLVLLEPYNNNLINEMLEDDPELKIVEGSAYYMITIEIDPDYQGMGLSSTLFDAMESEMIVRGSNKLILHARVSNGFSNSLEKRYGDRIINKRRIDRWKYYKPEEPCDYMEIQLEKKYTTDTPTL